MVPLKEMSDQVWLRYQCLLYWKLIIFNRDFSTKVTSCISTAGHIKELKHLGKRQYLPHYWSNQGFTGNVVNRVMTFINGGSLENTRTVPLNVYFF